MPVNQNQPIVSLPRNDGVSPADGFQDTLHSAALADWVASPIARIPDQITGADRYGGPQPGYAISPITCLLQFGSQPMQLFPDPNFGQASERITVIPRRSNGLSRNSRYGNPARKVTVSISSQMAVAVESTPAMPNPPQVGMGHSSQRHFIRIDGLIGSQQTVFGREDKPRFPVWLAFHAQAF